jgi:hypothetical protein
MFPRIDRSSFSEILGGERLRFKEENEALTKLLFRGISKTREKNSTSYTPILLPRF